MGAGRNGRRVYPFLFFLPSSLSSFKK